MTVIRTPGGKIINAGGHAIRPGPTPAPSAAPQPVAPGQVTQLAAGTPKQTTVAVTYVAPAVGTGPITYAGLTQIGSAVAVANGGTFSATGGTFTGLTAGTAYTLLIKATNSAGSSTTALSGTVTTAAASTKTPPNSNFPITFAGAAGPLTGVQMLTGISTGPGTSANMAGAALDGSGHLTLPSGDYQLGGFVAAGVVPDGALNVPLASGGGLILMFRATADLSTYYSLVFLPGDLIVLQKRVAGQDSEVGRYNSRVAVDGGTAALGVSFVGSTIRPLVNGGAAGSGFNDGSITADGRVGVGSANQHSVLVQQIGFQTAAQADAAYAAAHPAPVTTAAALTFNGPAGAPSGVEALTAASGTASIAQMLLTGSGALNLGSTALTYASLSGVGSIGNGTVTVNYAAGTGANKEARLGFGSYTWQFDGTMALYGPGGQVCSLPLTPSASFGVSVNNDVALLLVDGKVAYTLHAVRTALWGPLFIGTINYPSYTLIDSITVDPTPLPMPVLAPLAVAPRQVSTSVPAGYPVLTAQVATVGPTQVFAASGTLQTFAVTGPDVALFYMQPSGTLTTTAALVLGDKHISVVTTDNASGTSRTDALTIPVPQGTVLPSTNIQLAIPQNLNNNMLQPVVGTPTVTGITGTKSWTLFNSDHHIGVYGEDYRQLLADPVTGAVTFAHQPPAREGGNNFTLSCSDGINTASADFNVPVAFFVGPSVYCGVGDANSHPGFDHYFKHLGDLMLLCGDAYKLDDPTYAGSVVTTDDGGDDNYFVDDWQTDLYRAMWHGPLHFKNIGGPNGRRTRIGGPVGAYNGGIAGGDKAAFLCAGGDFIFEGIRFTRGLGTFTPLETSGGRSALRFDADNYGDLTVINCQFDNNANGLETGDGPGRVTVRNSVFFNNGGCTQGAGQTHAAYINGAEIIYENNLSYNNNVGHCLKTRALKGTIRNSVLADGATGSASSQLNIPQLGTYLVENNVFQKGPNHQNSACIGYGEDDYGRDRHDLLTLNNNTFIIQSVQGIHNGNGQAIRAWCRLNTLNGAASHINATENSFYFNDAIPVLKIEEFDFTGNGSFVPWTETGSIMLAAPPALNLADPGTAQPPAENPGFYNYLFYYGGGDYANMDGVQIASSVKDIRVSASAGAGTVLATLTPYGADLWKALNVPNDIRVNPFVAGSTVAITQDPEYFGGAVWAPVGRYSVVLNSNGTAATLQYNGGGVAGKTDVVKVRWTAPNGTLADFRFVIGVTA